MSGLKAGTMGTNGQKKEISLIIPAFNEEERITDVIEAAQSSGLINEICVVNDGSIDRTGQVSYALGAKVINLPENLGKGCAMQRGIESVNGDILVFSDADILGIKGEHFRLLIEPLIDDISLHMTVGKFSGGRLRTDLSHNLMPSISGQRALSCEFAKGLPNLSGTRFGAEIIITRHAKSKQANVLEVTLSDLTHVMKEEKYGVMRGMSARIKMYQEIIKGIKTQKKA